MNCFWKTNICHAFVNKQTPPAGPFGFCLRAEWVFVWKIRLLPPGQSDYLKVPMKCYPIWFAALLLLAAGCAHSHSREGLAADNAWQVAPPVIAALTGPGALLLTNEDGWQAQLTLTLNADAGHPRQVSGQLAESKGRLYFESEPGGKNISGRFALIWDTGKNQGWVMSEALQGVAPLIRTNGYRITGREPNSSTTDNLAGHPVQNALVTLLGSDGQTSQYQVAQAADLAQLALQIHPLAGPEPVSLTLSKVRLTPPADTLFLPPDDFSKYTSEAALLNELISRQRAVFNDNDEYHPPSGALDQSGTASHFQNNPAYQR